MPGQSVLAWATTCTPGQKRLRPRENACAQATIHAPGRQRLCPCDNGCCAGGVFFHKHPKLQRSGDDVCVQATTPASGRQRPHACRRQRVCPCDDGCRLGGVYTPNFNARATTSASGRQRLRMGDYVRARATTSGSYRPNVGIFFCFGNPNKTFPLSLFKNYSNCVEHGNPKLFLLVGVFLSALNRDLAFLSRHLSV